MAAPRCANSRQAARPSPVAPPVTMATRPCIASARPRGSGRSCTTAAPAGAGASRAARVQEYPGKLRNLRRHLKSGKPRRNLAAMRRLAAIVMWSAIAALGAVAFAVLALSRGEPVNAAVCTYVVAYRFYSKFLAERVFALDPRRATPAERFNNGRDFVPTNKWVLFGHHFAAIAGAGPLVGPVLAAQFGYLPGTKSRP